MTRNRWIIVNTQNNSVTRPGCRTRDDAVAYAETEYGKENIVSVNDVQRVVYVSQIPML